MTIVGNLDTCHVAASDVHRVFPVSTPETNRGTSRREDFWFIVAARSEDETEIRAGQSAGRTIGVRPAGIIRRKIKNRIVLEGLTWEKLDPATVWVAEIEEAGQSRAEVPRRPEFNLTRMAP